MLTFFGTILKVPDNLFIFPELLTQLFFLLLDPLVQIIDEVIEVVLPFELGFTHLVDIQIGVIVVSSSEPFDGVGPFTLKLKFGSLEGGSVSLLGTDFEEGAILMVEVDLLSEGVENLVVFGSVGKVGVSVVLFTDVFEFLEIVVFLHVSF